MTRVVSPDREGAELAGQALEGLELLADGLEKEGDLLMPPLLRGYARQLSIVPTASLDLAIRVADALDMLGQRCADTDRPQEADTWRWRAQRCRERAFMRAIGRTVRLKPRPR